MTFDAACAACAETTGMSAAEWSDFLACSPDQQSAIAETYRDAEWTKHADTFSRVLAILTVAAQVAGAVSGIGSAVAVLKGLL